jgi:hypothetical protein
MNPNLINQTKIKPTKIKPAVTVSGTVPFPRSLNGVTP